MRGFLGLVTIVLTGLTSTVLSQKTITVTVKGPQSTQAPMFVPTNKIPEGTKPAYSSDDWGKIFRDVEKDPKWPTPKVTKSNELKRDDIPWLCLNAKERVPETYKPYTCANKDIKAYSVTYSDCAQPFIFCRCPNADMSLSEAQARVGKVPVGLRNRMQHIHLMVKPQPPEKTGSSIAVGLAYNGRYVQLYGNCPVKLIIHEAAHCNDREGKEASSPTNSYGTKIMNPLVKEEKCVTDPYGLTNTAEAYANLMVLHVYKMFNNNKLSVKPSPNEHCLDKQLSRMEKDWPKDRLWPNTCVASDRPGMDAEDAITKKLGRNRRDLILSSRAPLEAHVDVWTADDSQYA